MPCSVYPNVLPKNMEGAGSLRLANWLYNVAPKDGSAFGINGRGTGFDPLLGNSKAQFDATRYTWIGSANNEVSICVAWHTSPIKKFGDMLTHELIVGGTSSSADTDQFPKITNGVLGTKMKVVTGYPGGNEVGLAMERGEAQGRCGWSWSSVKATHQKSLEDRKFSILVQLALDKHPEQPDVQMLFHWNYVNERMIELGVGRDNEVGWYIVKIKDHHRQEMFRNKLMHYLKTRGQRQKQNPKEHSSRDLFRHQVQLSLR